MKYDIFISHSSKSSKTAMAIVDRMEADGIKCWVAPRDLDPGSQWAEGIIDGIEACTLFLLLICPAANESPQVLREVERAAAKNVPIIPVLSAEVTLSKSLEYFVSSHHWFQIDTPPSKLNLAELTKAVAKKLGNAGFGEIIVDPTPPPPPPRSMWLFGVSLLLLLCVVGYYWQNPSPSQLGETAWHQVEELVSEADYSVPISTNKITFAPDDLLEISCVPPKTGYLTIFSHTLGTNKVTMLFPNKAHLNNLVQGGEKVDIPGANETFTLKADADTGKTILMAFLHPDASRLHDLQQLQHASNEYFLEVDTSTVLRGFNVEVSEVDFEVGAGKIELQGVK